jgi:hypothetical protein
VGRRLDAIAALHRAAFHQKKAAPEEDGLDPPEGARGQPTYATLCWACPSAEVAGWAGS